MQQKFQSPPYVTSRFTISTQMYYEISHNFIDWSIWLSIFLLRLTLCCVFPGKKTLRHQGEIIPLWLQRQQNRDQIKTNYSISWFFGFPYTIFLHLE